MKNTVTLVGFVGNTPEVRNTQSEAARDGEHIAAHQLGHFRRW